MPPSSMAGVFLAVTVGVFFVIRAILANNPKDKNQ
jgi:hypothetical protein